MFWELYQQSRINNATKEAAHATNEGRRAAHAARAAEDRIDRLTLVCNAMWSLMSEITGLTDEQLEDRIKDIDLSDGKMDGKVRAGVRQCPSCDRPLSSKHAKCMYCGSDVETDPFSRMR